MNILEVYEKYKIMPQLQLHQLRVAAVANQICDHIKSPVDKDTVITACLLHDMGNIIKFNLKRTLDVSGDLVKPEDLSYWEAVQREFIETYGQDEHIASIDIARKLGVSEYVLECIESIDFGSALKNSKRAELEPKICDYADLRVSPHGIVSIDGRLEDGRKRYKDNPERWVSDEQWQALRSACYSTEKQVFDLTDITPTDITDQSIEAIIKKLKQYSI